MTITQISLQLVGLLSILFAFSKPDAVFRALVVSFLLQYQVRDLLFLLNLNPNIRFGIETDDVFYAQTIFYILMFNVFLLLIFASANLCTKYRSEEIKIEERLSIEDKAIGFSCMAGLLVAFFYFGGIESRAEMIQQKGSSILFLLSLSAVTFLCHKPTAWSFLILIAASVLSTQKLLVLSCLLVYSTRFSFLKTFLSLIFGTSILIVISIFREPELAGGTIINFFAGTIFGHYESVLPLYKLLSEASSGEHYPFWQVFITPILELVQKEEKFFETFNQEYVQVDGIIIAPSLLGFFFYYLGSISVFFTAVYVFAAVIVVRKFFTNLVGAERSEILSVSVALLFLESSPDGLSAFFRISIFIFVLKLGFMFLKKFLEQSRVGGVDGVR